MTAPVKPNTVHKDAYWLNDQWHMGKLSKSGKPVGRYQIWNKIGTMMMDGHFTKSGKINWLKSHYPDGVVGMDVVYDRITNSTQVTYQSSKTLCNWLLTPLALGDRGYAKKSYPGQLPIDHKELFNGSPEGVTYYDEVGQVLSTHDADDYRALIQRYLVKDKDEKWRQALQRLADYWDEFKLLWGSDGVHKLTDYFSIHFEKNVCEEDIRKAEQRLGIPLPISYKEFILTEGLVCFGKNDQSSPREQRMMHPDELNSIDHLLDPEGTGDYDSYYSKSKTDRSKLVGFFIDQEDTQYEGWIAFDCSYSSEEYPILDQIGSYTIGEWESKIGQNKMISGNSMDSFISTYVDKLIQEREP